MLARIKILWDPWLLPHQIKADKIFSHKIKRNSGSFKLNWLVENMKKWNNVTLILCEDWKLTKVFESVPQKIFFKLTFPWFQKNKTLQRISLKILTPGQEWLFIKYNSIKVSFFNSF